MNRVSWRSRQRIADGAAVVLAGDDVIDLEGHRGRRLGQVAVFASHFGSLPDVLDQA